MYLLRLYLGILKLIVASDYLEIYLSMTDSQQSSEIRCPYGFTCHEMTTQSHIAEGECEFFGKCTKAVDELTGASSDKISNYINKLYKEHDALEKKKQEYSQNRVEHEEYIRNIDRRLNFLQNLIDHESSADRLISFGNHQSFQSFCIKEKISQLEESLSKLKLHLSNLNRGYIAPKGVEVHSYNVKHTLSGKSSEGSSLEEIEKCQKIYKYHKLTSKIPQFKKPLDKSNSVEDNGKKNSKVIHLRKRCIEDYIQARLGIERRNRLSKIKTQVEQAEIALWKAEKLADVKFCFEDYVEDYNKISENS